MIVRLAFFLGAMAACALGLILYARMVWGDPVAVAGLIALAVCAVPATLTLLLSEWALRWPPEYQVAAILGGTGLRMFVVAVVAFALFQQVPFLREETGFMNWVLVFYGLTLALEVGVLLWAMAANRPSIKGASAPVSTPE